MNAFVAIDFETADAKRDSACAVGVCRVEGGRIVHQDSALIRPPRAMSPDNTAVHGLTWSDVCDAPAFPEVWQKVSPILDGAAVLVAHNAPFDRSVLDACCKAANLPAPPHRWVCTLELSRARWASPLSNKLPDVCARLGIHFVGHHKAGADAEACAKVMLALGAGRATVAPSFVPAGQAGAILDEIPPPLRTPAVLQLMCDAQQLGPDHARDLVRRVTESAAAAGALACPGCGGPRSWLVSRCPKCRTESPA